MTGILVTGHGSFASGITSGLALISGMPENYAYVDFTPELSPEALQEKLEGALEELKECGQVLVCTDLKGGTPFNVASQMKAVSELQMEVIAGTNFPLLLEASLSRMMTENVTELARQVVASGKDQIVLYEPLDLSEEEFDE